VEEIELAIRIQSLSYRYRKQQVCSLSDVSFSIKSGDRVALLGSNGAGKTTLIHCITGVLPIQDNQIFIFNKDLKIDTKKRISNLGFVPQDYSLYSELTVMQNLFFFGAWYGLTSEKIEIKSKLLLQQLELETYVDKPVKYLSGGIKRRINLAIGLLHDPTILILDEPTVGIDVQSRNNILKMLMVLNKSGTTLLYSSHQLSEAEELCNRVVFLNNGKVVACDSIFNLLRDYETNSLEALFSKLS